MGVNCVIQWYYLVSKLQFKPTSKKALPQNKHKVCCDNGFDRSAKYFIKKTAQAVLFNRYQQTALNTPMKKIESRAGEIVPRSLRNRCTFQAQRRLRHIDVALYICSCLFLLYWLILCSRPSNIHNLAGDRPFRSWRTKRRHVVASLLFLCVSSRTTPGRSHERSCWI